MFETFCILTAIYVIGVFICSAFKSGADKISRCGTFSTYDDDRDPWNLRQLELRNNRFKDGPLWILRSDFDGSRYHAVITCSYHPMNHNVYADSISELEDKIDAEYVNIMNQYESITGMEYFEYKDGLIYGWKNERRVVTGRY